MKNFFYKGIDLNGKEISGYLLAEYKYIAENIFIRLDQESLFACRIVASAWKNILKVFP